MKFLLCQRLPIQVAQKMFLTFFVQLELFRIQETTKKIK